MLISEKINSDIYFYVLEHLDEILLISETEEDLKNNIKLFTYYYLVESNSIYFIESFSDMTNTIKTVFWSTTLPAWTGKIGLSNWLAGIASSTLMVGKFTIATSFLSQIVSKITGVVYKGSLSGSALTATNLHLIKVASLIIFPTVLTGMVIYRLIKYSDIQLIKNFELNLKSIIDTLRLTNKSELYNIYQIINDKYSEILANNCSKIEDEKIRLTCASQYYVKFITEDIITKVIYEYIAYSKANNIDLSYIVTFYDLISLNINVNPILSKRMTILYDHYNKLLSSYIFEPVLRKRYIDLLNTTTSKYIREAYL
jgi:hypothetical protein